MRQSHGNRPVTDEGELLRWLIEREVERRVREMSQAIAEEVLRELERRRVQVVRLHANHNPEE